MPSFKRFFKENRVPEWRTRYVRFSKLMELARRLPVVSDADVSSSDTETASALDQLVSSGRGTGNLFPDELPTFWLAVHEECRRVSYFFSEKLKVFQMRYEMLDDQAVALETQPLSKKAKEKAKMVLKKAFSEHYRSLDMLHNYCVLNQRALEKAAQRHDIKTTLAVTPIFEDWLSNQPFVSSPALDQLAQDSETLYANTWTNGNLDEAVLDLEAQQQSGKRSEHPITGFLVGCFAGLSVVGIATMIALMVTAEDGGNMFDRPKEVFFIYRAALLALSIVIAWGANFVVFEKANVNHAYILQINPQKMRTGLELLAFGFGLFILWQLSVIGYLFSQSAHMNLGVPGEWQPIILIGVLMIIFFWPFPPWRASRRWALTTTLRIFSAPWKPVCFRDFYLADTFTSLSAMFVDWVFTFCFYTVDAGRDSQRCLDTRSYWASPIVSLPFLWRAIQCVRRYVVTRDILHVANFFKYLSVLPVIVFARLDSEIDGPTYGVYTGFYVFFAAFSTFYRIYWDLRRDWGLFNRGQSDFPFRDLLLYHYKSIYVFVSICDILLRFTWIFTLCYTAFGITWWKEVYSSIFILLGCARRCMWNLFRMENEQVSNCGKFRAVREVPVPFSDRPRVQEMLSFESGDEGDIITDAESEGENILSDWESEWANLDDRAYVSGSAAGGPDQPNGNVGKSRSGRFGLARRQSSNLLRTFTHKSPLGGLRSRNSNTVLGRGVDSAAEMLSEVDSALERIELRNMGADSRLVGVDILPGDDGYLDDFDN